MLFNILLAFLIGGLFIMLLIFRLRTLNKSSQIAEDHLIDEGNFIKEETKVKKVNKDWKHNAKADKKFHFAHQWLICILKGHTANILDLDISSNGKQILSVGADRSIFLWKVKEIWQKERKAIRNTVNLDHATRVKFSPDDKACIVSLGIENILRVMKIKREPIGSYTFTTCADFPKILNTEIINIGIASNGNFIMTCHANTTVGVWTLKGDLLHTIDTGHMINYFGIVSPCGRFIAATGFSPDARVWAVEFDKTKAFKQVTRAFELKGHNSGILELCFTHDSTRVATISKDGTWRLWNIDIDYKFQDPILMKTGNYNYKSDSLTVHIALSTQGHCLCVAQKRDLYFINTSSGEVIESIPESHSDIITAVAYEPKNKIFLSSGGKHINVFQDIVTRQVELKQLKDKLKRSQEDKQNKQRIIEQIKELEQMLNNLLKNKTAQ